MSEMIATANAKSIEDIKSFISRTKETYKVPYETHPADRLRQCVFGGSSNTLDFLPLDRSGNRRFMPIMVHPEQAEVHILEDEAASRTYIDMMWAEAMFIYRNFPLKLTLSKEMEKELRELQKEFMPEDTKAGLIQSFLDNFNGTQVCSKLIYAAYLEAITKKIDEYALQYRELYTTAFTKIEGYTRSSLQAKGLGGLSAVTKAAGEAIAKIPVISKTQLDENLIGAGERLESFGDRRVQTRMRQLVDQQSSCIRPFVENIETIGRLYNRPMALVFNGEDLYLGEAAEA